nr:hypothetical protein [Tanacetum cinerariifolium]
MEMEMVTLRVVVSAVAWRLCHDRGDGVMMVVDLWCVDGGGGVETAGIWWSAGGRNLAGNGERRRNFRGGGGSGDEEMGMEWICGQMVAGISLKLVRGAGILEEEEGGVCG